MKTSSLYAIFLFLNLLSAFIIQAQPISGPVSINAALPTGGGNYQSFNALSSVLNTFGINGDLFVAIAPGSGPYLEQVTFSSVPGTGAGAQVYLEGNGELITGLTTTTERHVVRLSNTSYFNINNLQVSRDPASTGGFYGIHVFGSGSHISITNCTINMAGTTSTLYGGIVASGSLTSILETGDFHYLTISGNTTSGGGYGASVFGLITPLASNILISNNQFLDFHSNGVYLRETDGAVVSNNFFDKTTANITSCNAIQLAQAANINALVFNNFIQVSQVMNGTMTLRGIYLFNGTGHKVYNNVIHNIQLQSGNFTAIEVRTGGTAPQIYFNTISIDNPSSTTGKLIGIKEELSNTNSVLRNNMISISQPSTGGKSGLLIGSTASAATAFNSDYNDIWVPGGNCAQKGSLTSITYYPDLASWQSAGGQDMHSLSADPMFISPLLSQPANGTIDNLGTAIPWITVDIAGVSRSDPPDIGAYEFSDAPPAAPDSIYGGPDACQGNPAALFWVNPVSGASQYTWTVTGGANLVSGQGSNSISVAVGNTAFQLSVFASNASGNSPAINTFINVLPAPAVSLSLPVNVMCVNWPAVQLSGGIPANGTYSGNGINNGFFDPALAGTGLHAITYTFEASNGCAAAAQDSLLVESCTFTAEQHPAPLLIAPNPCRGECRISLTPGKIIKEVSLYNHLGMRVLRSYPNNHTETIHSAGLTEGLYYIFILTRDGEMLRGKLEVL